MEEILRMTFWASGVLLIYVIKYIIIKIVLLMMKNRY